MHLICIKKLLNEIYELGNEEEYLIRKTCTHLRVAGFFVRIFFPSYSFVILNKGFVIFPKIH